MTAWKNRWSQLTFAILSTVMLANLQYGWTLFVDPMHDANNWARAGIQIAFTIMIFVNTWLSPLEGWLVDRYGPRPVVMFGGLFAAISWILNARAESLQALYVSAVIGGLAIGCVFATCMGTALKWFPDKRGLATGMIAAGYGLGAALTAAPLATMIRSRLSTRVSVFRTATGNYNPGFRRDADQADHDGRLESLEFQNQ